MARRHCRKCGKKTQAPVVKDGIIWVTPKNSGKARPTTATKKVKKAVAGKLEQ